MTLPSSPYSPVSTVPMTPPGFTAAAAPTRFVFPPPVELLEPGVYEYGFQDFPYAYQDPRNGYPYFNAGQQVMNNGFQEQNPFGFMQDINGGYQTVNPGSEVPGNGHQNPNSEGPDVQNNGGCDEGLINGFEGREELSVDDPMAAYAEASADFAAMATLPDGFEEEQGDDDDEPAQGNRSIPMSLQISNNFSIKRLSKLVSTYNADTAR